MSSARNNRKRRWGRGRFGFLFKLLCALTLAAALIFGVTVFFQVEEVTVSGNARYTVDEVVRASGIQKGDNLFRMNKYAVSQKILQGLPYVEELSITRALPSTVVITVSEWDAVARVEPSGAVPLDENGLPLQQEVADGPWLISVGGKLTEPADRQFGFLSVTGLTAVAPRAGTPLSVIQSDKAKLKTLLLLLKSLEEQGLLEKVDRVDMSPSNYLTLRYDGRFDAKLPLGEDIAYHLKVLVKAVETLEDYEKGTMDLTQKDYAVVYSPDQ